MMKPAEKIEQLQNEIKQLERQVSSCRHEYGEAKFDPETKTEQVGIRGYERHGSDSWPIPEYGKVTKDRWSRTCKFCGHKQFTYEKEPVIISYKPKF